MECSWITNDLACADAGVGVLCGARHAVAAGARVQRPRPQLHLYRRRRGASLTPPIHIPQKALNSL